MPPNKILDVIAIHRGRNAKTSYLFNQVTQSDYNFDFRGVWGGSFLSPMLLIVKAWITSREIPEAKVYLIEGTQLFLVGLFLKLRYRSSKLALFINGPEFFEDPNLGRCKRIRTKLRYWLMRKSVSLYLPVSKMMWSDISHAIGKTAKQALIPAYVTNPERFTFQNFKRKPFRIAFVIQRPIDAGHVKGLDRVLSIFKNVREKVPEAELFLIGSGTEDLSNADMQIFGLGYQPVEKVLSECSVILSPARYESFNLSIIEGILSGVVPIVSDRIGAKEVLEQAGNDLILAGWNEPEWVAKILTAFSLEEIAKENLLSNIKKVLSTYRQETSAEALKQAIGDLSKL